ncbi:hypothetical protein LTR10_018129 [Elasticomyces elasticus]|uniref:Alpha/beta hydrolase fold-3 domain-containing protein n=1 Tax=Exophiala sideris TaxID=1016849 RepID=A0ABR0IY89_9EURO|nr:hypothetical protein LTR10_018129 [Elasticomyces elasticus]KAK5021727.1 hypothetical protein LTS07_010769 [Exophiala sideris]KAK5025116.1 hypothetical protein LTR13_010553 [Exophiala sideris]KAK5050159.1 hypothetical protein LTR69_010793 [Exophiala sideris]KAK5176907.1 hypothetical protein LTR44_010603 [Eurotiomycetes sp. CCFEE 6388]
MDIIAPLGTGIGEVVGPTYAAYEALLKKPKTKDAIHNVKKETFSYGPHERQKLDLYTAPTTQTSGSQKARPILVFSYGGGFASGDKILDAFGDGVVYANVGAFFASKLEFDTVVLDYRLLKHGGRYPSGGEDFKLALNWIQDKLQQEEKREIYVVANSAGAVHFTTWLFAPDFVKERAELLSGSSGVQLTKVVLLGCPFRLDYNGGMHPMLQTYYGGQTETKKAEPSALLLAAIEESESFDMKAMPPILTAVAELDPDFITEPGQEFSKLWKEHGGTGEFFVLSGHNHISPPLSLGTGIAEEERWGYQVARWLQRGTLE